MTAFIPLAPGTAAKNIDVKIGVNDFKLCLKTNLNEPLISGKFPKKVNPSECFWNIERDGEKSTMNLVLAKQEGKNWWNCLIQGDIEIDT